MRVLAVDQGTSGTKALLVEDDGSVLAAAERAVRPRYLADGGVEQDPDALLESVLEAGRAVLQGGGGPPDAVALANQGETVLVWDPSTGRPLSQAVVWQDRRSEDICRRVAGDAGMLAAATGLVLDPYFSAPKMAWLRRYVTADGVVTTTDTWLVHRLCGAFVTDVTTASRSLLMDLDHHTWRADCAAVFRLDGEQLPDIVSCDRVVGETTAFGAARPVGGLVVDQQAALLAEGCLDPGTAKCTFGTGAFLLANVGDSPLRSSSGLTTSVAWRTAGSLRYCTDGQVYAAASAVSWLIDLGVLGSASDIDLVAADDSEGVLCVPSLAGLAAPWWRPQATATVTGMTLSTRAGHLVAAVMEGIAAQVAEVAEAVEADLGSPMSSLRVDGGLTACRRLMQASADVLQVPVEVYPHAHATALGAAALGRLALTPGADLAAAVPVFAPAAIYEPQWSADRAAAYRQRWREAAAATVGDRTP